MRAAQESGPRLIELRTAVLASIAKMDAASEDATSEDAASEAGGGGGGGAPSRTWLGLSFLASNEAVAAAKAAGAGNARRDRVLLYLHRSGRTRAIVEEGKLALRLKAAIPELVRVDISDMSFVEQAHHRPHVFRIHRSYMITCFLYIWSWHEFGFMWVTCVCVRV